MQPSLGGGGNGPAGADQPQGFGEAQAVVHDEVRDDHGAGAGHAHLAVDEDGLGPRRGVPARPGRVDWPLLRWGWCSSQAAYETAIHFLEIQRQNPNPKKKNFKAASVQMVAEHGEASEERLETVFRQFQTFRKMETKFWRGGVQDWGSTCCGSTGRGERRKKSPKIYLCGTALGNEFDNLVQKTVARGEKKCGIWHNEGKKMFWETCRTFLVAEV